MNLRHLGLSLLGLTGAAVACSGLACSAAAPSPVLGSSPGPLLLGLTSASECSVCKCDGTCNGLSTEALRQSPKLLEFLGGLPALNTTALNTITADARKELERADPAHDCGSGPGSCASKLMAYIVSCALDAGESVEVRTPPGIDALRWTGEMGLCNGGTDAPQWPNPGCREAVSACVLARINALDQRVPISIRGEPGTFAPPLRPQIPVQRELRERDGADSIESFNRCLGTPAGGGDPSRDCGWAPRSVGRCAPGQPVSLRLNSGSGTMVRVCKGIHGCNHAGAPPAYGGLLTEVDSTATDITFKCPTIRTGRPYAYFGVMVASDDPGAPLPDPMIDVTPKVPATDSIYPAPEEMVFTYREGAFYGNIFTPAAPLQSVQPLSLLGDQYACYDTALSPTNAELAGRLCALRSRASCFGNNPSPCLDAVPPLLDSCLRALAPPQGSYLECHGFKGVSNPVWPHGLTVFLNDPSDFDPGQAPGGH